MEYMVNRRINNIVLKLTLSLLQLLSFFNFYSCFCTEESINDFVSLLYCVSKIVVPQNNRNRIKQELENFIARTKENIIFFKTNSEILSLLIFFEGVIKIFN